LVILSDKPALGASQEALGLFRVNVHLEEHEIPAPDGRGRLVVLEGEKGEVKKVGSFKHLMSPLVVVTVCFGDEIPIRKSFSSADVCTN
jgi:hypothetical protein